jgi:hypothetical protein
MKPIRIITGLLTLLLINLAVQYASASPEVFAFAAKHGCGALHAFVFGNPLNGFALANVPALMTMFSQQVEKRTRPNNDFIVDSVDESVFVNGEKVVTPIEGDDPNGVTNPTKFPLQLEQNDDDSHEWPISLHATLPQRISDDQMLMVNYEARQLIINRHMAVIEAMAARKILYDWAPTSSVGKIINANGAVVKSTLTNWGATGNRKVAGKDDIIDAITALSEDDADGDIRMLIPAGFYANLLKIADFIDYNKTGRSDLLAKGFIGEIAGAKVRRRSTGIIYNSAGEPIKIKERKTNNSTKAFTVNADDNQAILIWNPTHVTRAFGPITPYIDPKSGQLLGGSVNFSQRAGGKKRQDGMGIIAIREVAV